MLPCSEESDLQSFPTPDSIDAPSRRVNRKFLPSVLDSVSNPKESSPAERLREAREAAGLTQEAAADLLGVTSRTISRWETGGTVGQPELLAALTAYREREQRTRRLVREGAPNLYVDAMSGDWSDMLDSGSAEAYLAEVLAEAKKLGIPHEWRDAALLAIKQPPTESARPAGAPWGVEEVVGAMKDQGEPIRRQWRIWARNR